MLGQVAPVTPVIELLWCDGCPSHPDALAQLRRILVELGRPRAEIALRKIATYEEAVAERFVGSPTIRIDRVDLGCS